MTQAQLNELLRNNPSLAARNAQLQAGPKGLHSSKPEQDEGGTLDYSPARKTKDRTRFEIVFTIYAVRPADWDNWHTKILQDLLIRAGIIHGDDWSICQGRVIPKKASAPEEERTEVEVTAL